MRTISRGGKGGKSKGSQVGSAFSPARMPWANQRGRKSIRPFHQPEYRERPDPRNHREPRRGRLERSAPARFRRGHSNKHLRAAVRSFEPARPDPGPVKPSLCRANHFCALKDHLCATRNNFCALKDHLCGRRNHFCALKDRLCGSKDHLCALRRNVCGTKDHLCGHKPGNLRPVILPPGRGCWRWCRRLIHPPRFSRNGVA